MTSNRYRTVAVVLGMYAVALYACALCASCDGKTAYAAPWQPAPAGDPALSASSFPASLRRSVAPSLSSADIQSALDRTGYCWIPPGRHALDRPLTIKSGQRLAGAGFASQLIWSGSGDVAIAFGLPQSQAAFFGASIDHVQLIGGTLRVVQLAQHCSIDSVWVSNATADAFIVDGDGERLTLRDCIAWGAARHGFAVTTISSVNGVRLENCNAQSCGGAGVYLAALGPNAQLNQTVLANCTIQGNQRRGAAPAEVWISGYVGQTVIRDTWIECPGHLGLRVEPLPWLDPQTGLPVIRRAGFLTIEGTTVISACATAAELIDAPSAAIDSLLVTAPVVWSLRPPGGAQRMLSQAQLLDADTLPVAASQPAPVIRR